MILHRLSHVGSYAFPHEPVTIDFAALPTLLGLSGANGAGKTTLLDLIPGALFLAFPYRPGALHRQFVTKGFIELVWETDQVYVSRVTVDPDSERTEATLVQDVGDRLLAGPLVREYRRAMEERLGTLDAFLASAYSVQSGVGAFLRLPRAGRKALLTDWLGLGVFPVHEETAKGQMRAAEGTLASLRARLTDLEARIATRVEHEATRAQVHDALDDNACDHAGALLPLAQHAAALSTALQDPVMLPARPALGFDDDAERITAYRRALDEWEATALAVDRCLDDVDGALSDLDVKETRIAIARVALLRQLHATALALRTVADAEVAYHQTVAHQGPMADDCADWSLLAKAFGPSGIPALLIDQALPEIGRLATDLLRECYGESVFTITLTTQRDNASGDKRLETLDVVVARGGDPIDAALLSGGESVLVSEALSLALALYNAARSGRRSETLLRDEVGAPLDVDRAPAYVRMLRRAAQLGGFHHVLFVSHQPACLELADAVLCVERGAVTCP